MGRTLSKAQFIKSANHRGFTLVDLILFVSIGVLAALSINAFLRHETTEVKHQNQTTKETQDIKSNVSNHQGNQNNSHQSTADRDREIDRLLQEESAQSKKDQERMQRDLNEFYQAQKQAQKPANPIPTISRLPAQRSLDSPSECHLGYSQGRCLSYDEWIEKRQTEDIARAERIRIEKEKTAAAELQLKILQQAAEYRNARERELEQRRIELEQRANQKIADGLRRRGCLGTWMWSDQGRYVDQPPAGRVVGPPTCVR